MNKKKGFTLIELIMVIVVLGALSAIAIPKFTDLRKSANQAACKAAGGALRAAIANYYASYEAHTGSLGWPSACTSAVLSSYLQSWPKSPAAYGQTSFSFDAWSDTSVYSNVTGKLQVETACSW